MGFIAAHITFSCVKFNLIYTISRDTQVYITCSLCHSFYVSPPFSTPLTRIHYSFYLFDPRIREGLRQIVCDSSRLECKLKCSVYGIDSAASFFPENRVQTLQ